ncbi:MAG: hypothetical protein A2X49_00730 [Lentisphaerae bacterium GWF2_52_8]|nr:MAG: hypothetical protein A2X49_00730 [Lentisphaerae bacterium GWF2_52_8]
MTDQNTSIKDKAKAIFWFLLRLGIAAGIIAYLLSSYQGNLLESLGHFNPVWILLALCCYASQICFGAWRWLLLLRVQGIQLSFFEALSLTMQGIFFSLVIPGGAVGGDLAKISFLASRTPPGQKIEGAFTIFMDRFTGMLGLFAVALAVPLFAGQVLKNVNGVMELALYALVLAALGGFGAGVVFLFHKQFENLPPFAWCLDLADKHMHGALRRIFATLDLYKNSWKTVLFCIAGSVILVHLNIAVAVYCLARGDGAREATLSNVVATVTIGNTAGAIPITPSGIGARDAVINSMLKASGLPEDKALEIPLLNTAIILAYSMLGGLFFVLDSMRKKPFQKEIPAP